MKILLQVALVFGIYWVGQGIEDRVMHTGIFQQMFPQNFFLFC